MGAIRRGGLGIHGLVTGSLRGQKKKAPLCDSYPNAGATRGRRHSAALSSF